MGRSKPRTNKRPPPKALKAAPPTNPPQPSVPGQPRSQAILPPFDVRQVQDIALSLPPAAGMNPTDPIFNQALQTWSAQALGRLDQLPKFSQAQLNALASAAAGMGEKLGSGTGSTNPNLPVDLPASLAALFEAKLTLDREKAKLVRMQNELKGYREGVAAVQGNAVPNGKGKEAVREEDYGECTCGRAHHAYSGSAHSGEFDEEDEYYDSEYECEDCDCDCHYTCEHEEGCDCEVLDEDDHHHHHHHHHHHEHGDDEECMDDEHSHHHHNHQHHHHHHEDLPDVNVVPNPYLKNQPQLAQHPLQVGDAQASGWAGYAQSSVTRRPIAEDPERLEVAVSELFRWIKAVVWTLEQTKKMSGRAVPLAQM